MRRRSRDRGRGRRRRNRGRRARRRPGWASPAAGRRDGARASSSAEARFKRSPSFQLSRASRPVAARCAAAWSAACAGPGARLQLLRQRAGQRGRTPALGLLARRLRAGGSVRAGAGGAVRRRSGRATSRAVASRRDRRRQLVDGAQVIAAARGAWRRRFRGWCPAGSGSARAGAPARRRVRRRPRRRGGAPRPSPRRTGSSALESPCVTSLRDVARSASADLRARGRWCRWRSTHALDVGDRRARALLGRLGELGGQRAGALLGVRQTSLRSGA